MESNLEKLQRRDESGEIKAYSSTRWSVFKRVQPDRGTETETFHRLVPHPRWVEILSRVQRDNPRHTSKRSPGSRGIWDITREISVNREWFTGRTCANSSFLLGKIEFETCRGDLSYLFPPPCIHAPIQSNQQILSRVSQYSTNSKYLAIIGIIIRWIKL